MADTDENPNGQQENPSSTLSSSLAQPAITPIATLTSSALADTSQLRRPRDARLVHIILASLGINAYQERVPLQLLDFTYRYTSSVLQDALYLNAEGYAHNGPVGSAAKGGGGGVGAAADTGNVSLAALRLSIASRLSYQFNSCLPKEFLLEMAAERNRVALPTVGREWGLRLPPERYCLTGVGWGLKEEWLGQGEEDEDGSDQGARQGQDVEMGADGEEEGDAAMEDVFGEALEDTHGQDGEDKDMQ